MMNRKQALEALDWASRQNPGPWREHSLTAARAASAIAAACGMDAERAYVLGAMHDIGRYEGVRGMHHAIAGYEWLHARGEDESRAFALRIRFRECESTTQRASWT